MINEELRDLLEKEEKETVSDAFGGEKSNSKRSFSVTKIRDLVLSKEYSQDNSPLGRALYQAQNELPKDVLKVVVANLIRFSFLIELTNLKVGSTKMKTRWLPGKILKPQDGSFEPVQGDFSPGDDPRASTYENCVEIFIQCLNEITNRYKEDDSTGSLVRSFDKCSSVPYEFFFDYIDPALDPVHTCNNVEWVYNNDAKWLLQARPLIKDVLDNKLHNKIKTKTYKTDRALTGKDKTNRAKRWDLPLPCYL